MMHPRRFPSCLAWTTVARLLLFLPLLTTAASAQAGASRRVQLTILDENDVVVPDARVTVVQLGQGPVELLTSPAGRAEFSLFSPAPYRLQVAKPGFYQTLKRDVDPQLHDIELILQHQQI